MKQLYATTIALLLSFPALHAQRIHFTDTSNKWVTTYTFFDDAGEGTTYYPHYKLRDTVFNGESGYVYYDGLYSTEYPLFLTEDTTERKVYARKMYDSDTARFVLYDFNLTVGDSVLILPRYGTTAVAHICYEVYPDVLINGVPHHAFHMSTAVMGYWVIEGIGSVFGPLHPFIGAEEWMSQLICFENNGSEPEFSSLFTSYCYLSVDDQDALIPAITLSPNPALDLLHISSSQIGSLCTYSICDITGRQVYQGILKEKATLDISTWQSGMYIVHLTDKKGSKTTSKFIKN